MTIMFRMISYYLPGMTKVFHLASVTSNGKAIFTLSGISHLTGISAGLQCAWATCFNLSQYINLMRETILCYYKAQIILRVITLTQLQRSSSFSSQKCQCYHSSKTVFHADVLSLRRKEYIFWNHIVFHNCIQQVRETVSFSNRATMVEPPPKTYLSRDV